MTEEPIQNAMQIAENALGQEAYDPFARAEERGFPSDEVSVYWDDIAARELLEHNQKLQAQSHLVATFTAALAGADRLKAELDESRADYKTVISKIQKAKQQDAKSAKEAQAVYDQMEADAEPIKARLEASKVTFGLMGFPTDIQDAIHEKLNALYPPVDGKQNPAWDQNYNAEIISAAIQWTQKAGEERNTTPITPAVVLSWRRKLPSESYIKLNRAVGNVALATGLFKSLEDAGFLAKS